MELKLLITLYLLEWLLSDLYVLASIFIWLCVHIVFRRNLIFLHYIDFHTYFCFIDYAKAFDCVDHSKLWEILQEMGIPDHLTCLLRNQYTGQEAS